MRRRLTRLSIGIAVLASAFTTSSTADAVPVDDLDGELVAPGYVSPDDGFDWAMRPRFRAFGVWNERGSSPVHSGPVETYAEDYVHPAFFDVTFAGCVDQADYDLAADEQPTIHTYSWTFDGVERSGTDCLVEHRFDRDGDHRVTLEVADPEGTVVASYDRTIELRDPGTSNLNVVPGRAIANLVVCRLGAGGALSIANPGPRATSSPTSSATSSPEHISGEVAALLSVR